MERSTLVAAILAASSTVALAADIPCTCRFDGRDMPHGSTVCIDLASGRYIARCVKVLNNTAWRKVQDGCDAVS